MRCCTTQRSLGKHRNSKPFPQKRSRFNIALHQVLDRLRAKRKNGVPLYILQGYGLTETSAPSHFQPQYAAHNIGSIGILLPNLEAKIVLDGEGKGEIDAEEGQLGELWLRGPSIMKVCIPCNLSKQKLWPDAL